jgi:hypothetical protein
MYLEAMPAVLLPPLPVRMLLKIVKHIVGPIAKRCPDAIVGLGDLKRIRDFIWVAQQNLQSIQEWPILIVLLSAKHRTFIQAFILLQIHHCLL